MNLDPKGKYLVKDAEYPEQPLEGRVYVWSEVQAAKKGMHPFDPVKGEAVNDLKAVPVDETEYVSIKLADKTFMVKPELQEVLTDMLAYIEEIKPLAEDNENLKEQIERHTTDILDLTEQNTALRIEKVQREAPPEEVKTTEETPAKKTRGKAKNNTE